jgi:thiol-disulfide isomerase/thioredoxin
MPKLIQNIVFALSFFSLNACFVIENRYTAIAPGMWRAVLQLTPTTITPNKKGEPLEEKMNLKFQESTEGELPFLFEVKYTNDTTFYIEIINGEERILVQADEINMGRDRQTGKDTILINFPVFGSYIRGVVQERVMEGEWVVPAKRQSITFIAHYGQNHRFTTLNKKNTTDLTGKWETIFNYEDSAAYNAVGEFKQNGNQLRGTFRTETGDYRYLDGEVQGDKLYLSCFDGSHAFLFEAKIKPDGSLYGIFRSGKTGQEIWSAKRNEKFDLRNAQSLTKVNTEDKSIDFTFPNADGRNISLKDYAGKVKIVNIMGTWCPNCRDETKFLTEYLKNNPSDKLAVISLAFERNEEVAVKQVRTYKEKMNIPYEILIAGTTTNKAKAGEKLPWLNEVMAFPTTLFLDKNNKVRRIHTGFDGPATGKYPEFVKDFDAFVKTLLTE